MKASDYIDKTKKIIVRLADKNGKIYSGTNDNKLVHFIKVSCCNDKATTRSIVKLGEESDARLGSFKGNARSAMLNGHMNVLGSRGLKGRTHYITTSKRKNEKSVSSLQKLANIQEAVKHAIKKVKRHFRKKFKHDIQKMKRLEKDFEIVQVDCMGGEKHSITCACIISVDLANEAHFDANDVGYSISIWAEKYAEKEEEKKSKKLVFTFS